MARTWQGHDISWYQSVFCAWPGGAPAAARGPSRHRGARLGVARPTPCVQKDATSSDLMTGAWQDRGKNTVRTWHLLGAVAVSALTDLVCSAPRLWPGGAPAAARGPSRHRGARARPTPEYRGMASTDAWPVSTDAGVYGKSMTKPWQERGKNMASRCSSSSNRQRYLTHEHGKRMARTW